MYKKTLRESCREKGREGEKGGTGERRGGNRVEAEKGGEGVECRLGEEGMRW